MQRKLKQVAANTFQNANRLTPINFERKYIVWFSIVKELLSVTTNAFNFTKKHIYMGTWATLPVLACPSLNLRQTWPQGGPDPIDFGGQEHPAEDLGTSMVIKKLDRSAIHILQMERKCKTKVVSRPGDLSPCKQIGYNIIYIYIYIYIN